MPRKAKKKMHRMPPLSIVDEIIYWTVFVLLCAADIALLFGPLRLRNVIAFADDSVVAAVENISFLWLLVPWMTFFLMTFIGWLLLYEARRPIFGKRNFKYGPPGWPKVYPLFMKNKPHVFVSEREKKNRKRIAVFLVVVLLLSFIPLPWSFYGRTCLHSDGSITQYNMFDKQVEAYSAHQIEEVELETYRHKSGKHGPWRWTVRMKIYTENGEKHTFRSLDFRGDAHWTGEMLAVKNRFNPGIICYEDDGKLKKVIEDQNLSPAEAKLLYELFGLG